MAAADQRVTVLVSYIRESTLDDTLRNCFKNKVRHGGGEIEAVRRCSDKTQALITFKDSAVAENMVRKGTLALDGAELVISWPPPNAETGGGDDCGGNVITVKGFPAQTTNDSLMYLLEAKVPDSVVNVVTIEGSTASVVFEETSHVEAALLCGDITLGGSKLVLSRPVTRSVSSPGHSAQGRSTASESRTIFVSGLNGKTTKPQIEGYFSSKTRSGGGPILDVKLQRKKAFVTFRSSSDLDLVMTREYHELGGSELSIHQVNHAESVEEDPQSFRPPRAHHQQPWGIEVSWGEGGKAITEQLLQLYFENERSSGGGPVRTLKVNQDDNLAAIAFEDSADVESVLRKHRSEPLQVDGHRLQVVELPAEITYTSCALAITGYPADTAGDTLMLTFENRRATGGEECVDFYFDVDRRRAVITYRSPEVCDRVVRKQPLYMKDCMLTVKPLRPARYARPPTGPTLPGTFLIGGLPPSINANGIREYVERLSNVTVGRVIFGAKPGVALLELSVIEDIDALKNFARMNPMKGVMVWVQEVVEPDGIQVYGVAGLHKELLLHYFENTLRSGGSQIRHVEKLGEQSDHAVISFIDKTVVDRVLNRRHELNSKRLNVRIYHPCLGVIPPGLDTSKPAVHIPTHTTVSCASSQLLTFITQHGQGEVLEGFKHCSAKVNWTNVHNGTIKIDCTLTYDDDDVRERAKEWTALIDQRWHHITTQMFTEVTVDSLQDTWSEFIKEAGDLTNSNRTKSMIAVDNGQCTVTICGFEREVSQESRRLNVIVSDLQERLDREKRAITETIKLNRGVLLTLETGDFYQTIASTYPNLKVTRSDSGVTFRGLTSDVTAAKLALYESTQSLTSLTERGWHGAVYWLLQQAPVREEIRARLLTATPHVVYEARDDCVHVWGRSEQDLRLAMTIIRSQIHQSEHRIERENSEVIRSNIWKKFIENIAKQYPNQTRIQITDDMSRIQIFCLESCSNYIHEEIDMVLQENSVYEKRLEKRPAIIRLMEKAYLPEIQQLESNLASAKIQITFHQLERVVLLKGTKQGLNLAAERIIELIDSILSIDVQISGPGASRYFLTKRGEDFIKMQELQHNVIIEKITEANSLDREAHTKPLEDVAKHYSKAVLCGDVQVCVAQGNLTKCEVDAIVNAANTELKHSGGVAAKIKQVGGDVIQDESDAYVRDHGKLLTGNVCVTGAGSLPCKKVIHAAGPKWQDGRQGEENLLFEAVWQSLEALTKLGLSSVAIPGIGAGIYRFPKSVSTTTIVSAVDDFCKARSKESSSLRKVILMDTDPEIVEGFHKALVSHAGQSAVVLLDRENGAHSSPGVSRPQASAPVNPTTPYVKVNDHTLRTASGLQVTFTKGELQKIKGDVIVNPSNTDLRLTGGLSAILAKAAGHGLATDLKRFAPLSHGAIAVTPGHNLLCKNVYHSNTGPWDGPGKKCEKNMKSVIHGVMTKASAQNHKSILIPAIGTGNYGVPPSECARITLSEIAKFSDANQLSSVKGVAIVIFPADKKVFAAFEAEVKRCASPPVPIVTPNRKNRALREGGARTPVPAEHVKAEPDDSLYGIQLNFGHVQLQVELGDITKEDTDAIAYGINKEMSFRKGVLAKSMAAAGGDAYLAACKQAVASGDMKTGIAVTMGGNFKARAVVHMALPITSSKKDVTKMMNKAFDKAIMYQFTSLAFPALGTGELGKDNTEMAGVMYDAVAEYSQKNPESLSLIKIIIHHSQPELLNVFQSEMSRKAKDGKLTIYKSGNSESGRDDRSPEEGGPLSLEALPPPPAQLTLRVWGRDVPTTNTIVEEINSACKSEMRDKILESTRDQENIAKLNESQVQRIKDFSKYGVRITVEKGRRINRIRLQGHPDGIATVIGRIYDIFLEVQRNETREQHERHISERAQWSFKDGDSWEEYPPEINAKIEQAFAGSAKDVSWEENEGKYSVKFTSMTEHSDRDTVMVRRNTALYELPRTWDRMADSDHYKLVSLDPASEEFKGVKTEVDKTQNNKIKSYVKIERVQNPSLHQRYQVHKTRMILSDASFVKERLLWHGTSSKPLGSINTYGFDRGYCGKNATMFGDGVYFARDASYSCRTIYSPPDPATGHRHLYLCRVLTGMYTKGGQGMRNPPSREGVILYDSVVDNTNTPGIFVIFSDTQAYPEYLITFT